MKNCCRLHISLKSATVLYVGVVAYKFGLVLEVHFFGLVLGLYLITLTLSLSLKPNSTLNLNFKPEP